MIYLLIQIVCIGTLPELASSQRPLADAANRFLGRAGAAIISAGIVISIAGNLHITLLSASRIPFAMGERGSCRNSGPTHARFHTPHYAILFTGTVMLVAGAVRYVYLCADDQHAGEADDLYDHVCRAPHAATESRSAGRRAAHSGRCGDCGGGDSAGCWLLSNSTWREARDTAIAAALGLVILAVSRSRLAVK